MTPWDEYVAAAQRLDAVRRAAAAVVAEHTAAVQAVRDDLAGGRARLAIQHARLLDTARQAGARPPVLAPQPGELAEARAALGGAPTPHALRASLHAARVRFDTADAVLSGVAEVAAGPARSAGPRNALIYGGYAMLAAVLEIAAFLTVPEEGAAALLVVGCGLLLPVFVFALGWLTVGAFRPPPGATSASRTPGIGAAMSLLALVPLLAVVVWASARALSR
jgi:hypothetical protein